MVSWVSRLFPRRRGHDCTEILKHSSDIVDGVINPETAARLKPHLDWCPPCRAFLNTLRTTVNLLGSLKGSECPPAFRERLRERLRDEASR